MICCFASNLFAQAGVVEVVGAKGEFFCYKKLNSNERLGMISPTTGNDCFTIQTVDENAIYLIGINGRVAFFQPSKKGKVIIEVTKDKFVFGGENKKLNDYLYNFSYSQFYNIANPLVNTYMGYVVCPNLLEVGMDYISDEAFPENTMNLKDKSLRDLKAENFTNKTLENQMKSLIEEMYWETLFYGYVILKKRPEAVLSKSLLATIDSYDMENPAFMKHPGRNMMVYNYLRVQADLGRVVVSEDNFIAEQAACLKNDLLREDYIMREINRFDGNTFALVKMVKACEPLFVTEKGKENYKQRLAGIESFTKKQTFDGFPAKEFEFENQKGEKVKLSDFKGKYVYIDLWATWCGPCKQEIPALVKLEEELKEKEIVFVSISLDKAKDKETWKEFLIKNKLHGVTLIAPSEFATPFVSHYGVTSIPRFMLVDKEGIMIANDFWRPRDPRLKEYLLKLLDKK